jgi:TRAP-type C4-dicarboxylate transport system substrate-binding protein
MLGVVSTKGSTRGGWGGTIRGKGAGVRGKRNRLIVALVAVVALAAAACSGGGSKSGGQSAPVVLKFADGYENLAFTPAVGYFIARVHELSGGNVTVKDVPGWGDLQPGFEQQIVRDVAAGKADLGWVGTRIFDTLGVNSFQALTAPMLIDSYPLEQAVVTSSIPTDMLRGLGPLHVTGLAVLADGLRKPIAKDGPLLAPSDWKGQTFDVFRSKGQMAAVAATGATPTDVSFGDVTYTAAERNLRPYVDNYVTNFPYVTANVNLWPQTLTLIANPASLSRLTSEQRGWVQQAAMDAAAHSTTLVDHDEDLIAQSCTRGGHVAEASEADLTSLRQAFDPVYAELEQDPQTKAFIAQIQGKKAAMPAAPALRIPPQCGAANPSPPTDDPLTGTWETESLSEGDVVHAFVAAGGNEGVAHGWFSGLGGGATKSAAFRLVFANGSLTEFEGGDGGQFLQGDSASYRIDGDEMTFLHGPCTAKLSVALDGDTLRMRFTSTSGCPAGDAPFGTSIYGTFPYHRVQKVSEAVQGTWETAALSESDFVHAFVDAGGSEADGHKFFALEDGTTPESVIIRVVFGDGVLDQYESADGGAFEHGDSNSYAIDGETMTATQPGCTGSYSVALSDDTLRLRIAAPYAGDPQCVESSPIGSTIYASFPFTRVSG